MRGHTHTPERFNGSPGFNTENSETTVNTEKNIINPFSVVTVNSPALRVEILTCLTTAPTNDTTHSHY